MVLLGVHLTQGLKVAQLRLICVVCRWTGAPIYVHHTPALVKSVTLGLWPFDLIADIAGDKTPANMFCGDNGDNADLQECCEDGTVANSGEYRCIDTAVPICDCQDDDPPSTSEQRPPN